MPQSETLLNSTGLQQWDGRIANGAFPLRQCLGGSDHTAVYLTELNGGAAVIRLMAADAPEAQAQLASWELARRLSHPNLVRILQTGTWHADGDQDMYFVVTEYCDESLAGVLAQRALTPSETREMLCPILEALKYLHGQGILHGQIDPKHILASGDRIKLSVDKVHRNGELHPSPGVGVYDPPEKAQGTISLSGDVWSLGITLAEVLTRELPKSAESGSVVLPEKLPQPFEEIVKGCLQPDRESRLSISGIGRLLEESPSQRAPSAVAVLDYRRPEPTIVQPQEPSTIPVDSFISEHEGGWLSPLAQKRNLVTAVVIAALLVVALGVLLSHRRPVQSTKGEVLSSQVGKAISTTENTAAPVADNHARKESSGAVLREVMPEVSGQARRSINGTVTVKVRVTVNPDGKVVRATLAERGPSTYFARQSLHAAEQWVFAASGHQGQAQPSVWTLRFEFRRTGTKANAQPSRG